MKHSLKIFCGLVSVILSLSSVANGNISIRDSCHNIVDYNTCEAHPRCYWDNGTDRCEHRDRHPCASYYTAYDCENARGCYWDHVDNRCERE